MMAKGCTHTHSPPTPHTLRTMWLEEGPEKIVFKYYILEIQSTAAACCSRWATAVFLEINSTIKIPFVLSVTAVHQKARFLEKPHADMCKDIFTRIPLFHRRIHSFSLILPHLYNRSQCVIQQKGMFPLRQPICPPISFNSWNSWGTTMLDSIVKLQLGLCYSRRVSSQLLLVNSMSTLINMSFPFFPNSH